jgi:hypothetical protein
VEYACFIRKNDPPGSPGADEVSAPGSKILLSDTGEFLLLEDNNLWISDWVQHLLPQ